MSANSEIYVEKRGGHHVYDALVEEGIELLVGLPGTQTLPLDHIVTEHDEIRDGSPRNFDPTHRLGILRGQRYSGGYPHCVRTW